MAPARWWASPTSCCPETTRSDPGARRYQRSAPPIRGCRWWATNGATTSLRCWLLVSGTSAPFGCGSARRRTQPFQRSRTAESGIRPEHRDARRAQRQRATKCDRLVDPACRQGPQGMPVAETQDTSAVLSDTFDQAIEAHSHSLHGLATGTAAMGPDGPSRRRSHGSGSGSALRSCRSAHSARSSSTAASGNPASSAVRRARRRGLVRTRSKPCCPRRSLSTLAAASPSGSNGRSVTDVCRASRDHSVSPCRTSHSSVAVPHVPDHRMPCISETGHWALPTRSLVYPA